jgi:hypothetical protein
MESPMGRYFLVAGQLMAMFGCVVSIIRVFTSIGELIEKWQVVTGDLIFAPASWVYAFIINGALVVVFARAYELKSKSDGARSH